MEQLRRFLPFCQKRNLLLATSAVILLLLSGASTRPLDAQPHSPGQDPRPMPRARSFTTP
jgi:hypothetical protein